MPAAKNDITAEFARSLFDYNKETGELFWKKTASQGRIRQGGNSRAGRLAGNVYSNGYRYVKIGKRYYLIHRIIFLIRRGKWPAAKIDHATGDILNNKKIRAATNSQNSFNQRKGKRNTSGYKGVSFHKGTKKWLAQIRSYKKGYYLGLFSTKEEAHEAYCAAAKHLHGRFANFG